MAYDIHVFRGNDWLSEVNNPISTKELLSVEGVEVVNNVSSTNPKTGITINVSNNDMFSYKEVIFTLKKGVITVAVRNNDVIETMRPLANALGAVIQGDEGEFY
ncbi:MAG: hypothetical protein IJ661_08810 [Lachnospiraceae bacterium]|nr:hypothetical protein [Lachnospiraceae bacterium]